MRPINYAAKQAYIKDAITNTFSGYPVIVFQANQTTATNTVGVFAHGLIKNIDNRQNPTMTAGETVRTVTVPGIDFVNPTTGVITIPQVGGLVVWTLSGTTHKKLISAVSSEVPVPNFPLVYTLSIE
jgi:hypothetical protein